MISPLPCSLLTPVQEVTLVFSLSNEPWVKYGPGAVADRGLRAHEWTRARLRSEALSLEAPR